MIKYKCEYDYGICTAPDTNCQFWHGTYCEIDRFWEEARLSNDNSLNEILKNKADNEQYNKM